MKGRPQNESRRQAIAEGKTLYEGQPCGKCGNTIRVVSNHACHYCLTKHSQQNTINRINQFRARMKYQDEIDLGF